MRSPDPWDARPPWTNELRSGELMEFLGVARRAPAYFSDFEYDFCESAVLRLRYRGELTEKQESVLNRWLLRKLRDNDPDLWKYELTPAYERDSLGALQLAFLEF
jgi:hypothetical protein